MSSNQWSLMSGDSSLYYGAYDCGATILRIQNSGHRYIIVAGSHYSRLRECLLKKTKVNINMIMIRPQWRDLTSGGSWTYMPSLSTHYYTRLIALSSTEAYMVTIIIIVVVVNQLLKNRLITLFPTFRCMWIQSSSSI